MKILILKGVCAILLTVVGLCHAKGSHRVHCEPDLMRVEVVLPNSNEKSSPSIYLDGMKGYPNPKCQPEVRDNLAEFKLSLLDIYECGVTRVVNKITGKKVFYHKIIIEGDQSFGKEVISVKCIITGPHNATLHNHGIVRRDVLPVGFQEPEDLEIATSITEKAPEPVLGVGVRQNGNLVSGDLNVSPGTPLQMEIFLDKNSAPVYGLGVTFMQVTDTLSQEETIIFNGCSVDPYLFENFNTEDGDFLTAKFRAFKFPESTFVQFRGTVNVCLDKCQGIQCSNGQIGYGRRRRAVNQTPADPNKIFEISLATFIKVNYQEGVDQKAVADIENKIKQLKLANQKLARNSRAGTMYETIKEESTKTLSGSDGMAKVEETVLFAREIVENSSTSIRISGYLMVSFMIFVISRIVRN
uniref:CSON014413 protein n=2 Tax=Culicoides sonorensis TaxID=179676 RepID=A0A336LI52_CULSO